MNGQGFAQRNLAAVFRVRKEIRALEVFQTISHHRRRLRKKLFQALVQISPEWRILDIGCGENFRSPWLEDSLNLEGLDIRPVERATKPYERFECGDACTLPFPDRSFDLVYSNSLIEHLPTREHQHHFASAVSRVGRYHWVQTPATGFPVDLPYLVPFFQHLPEKWQGRWRTDCRGAGCLAAITLPGAGTSPSIDSKLYWG